MKTERYSIIPRVTAIVALVLVLLTVTHVTSLAAGLSSGSTAYVNVDDYLNMRAEPQGEIIGKIARGEKVTILSGPDRNNYYQIRINKTGEVCYAYGDYLTGVTIEPNATSTPRPATTSSTTPHKEPTVDLSSGTYATVISDKKLNLREGPRKKANRVRYLTYGELVEILDDGYIQNNYIRVKAVSDGKIGYVDVNYIDFLKDDVTDVAVPGSECNCSCDYCY